MRGPLLYNGAAARVGESISKRVTSLFFFLRRVNKKRLHIIVDYLYFITDIRERTWSD